MQKLVITGGIPLEGTVTLQGAKNSVLPILAASLLCRGETVLENCPRLTDVFSACRILTALGCRCSMKGHVARIQADGCGLCGDFRILDAGNAVVYYFSGGTAGAVWKLYAVLSGRL